MAGRTNVLSLAQGIVHWRPPHEALDTATRLIQSDPSINGYGPAEGLPALRDALTKKIQYQNGIYDNRVMVTAGANQAFTNLVLALCDATDQIVLFKPYYFNHLMAIQMTGGADNVVYGECDPQTLHPDLDWLERQLSSPRPPKLVVVVNPCNPTGVLLSQSEIQRAADLCSRAGSWLILDNTYEQFVYGGRQHHCASGPNIINVFSFSKAYGMMGWRVGYMAYPDVDGRDSLGAQITKVQDTIPICAPQLSQHVALAALQHGDAYVAQQVASLAGNRAALIDALSPLGELGGGRVAGGEGAIYLWASLPEGCEDDEAVVAWLIREHGVCVIPGSACGSPGFIRAAYANLQAATCAEAAQRLKGGLELLSQHGAAALHPAARVAAL